MNKELLKTHALQHCASSNFDTFVHRYVNQKYWVEIICLGEKENTKQEKRERFSLQQLPFLAIRALNTLLYVQVARLKNIVPMLKFLQLSATFDCMQIIMLSWWERGEKTPTMILYVRNKNLCLRRNMIKSC